MRKEHENQRGETSNYNRGNFQRRNQGQDRGSYSSRYQTARYRDNEFRDNEFNEEDDYQDSDWDSQGQERIWGERERSDYNKFGSRQPGWDNRRLDSGYSSNDRGQGYYGSSDHGRSSFGGRNDMIPSSGAGWDRYRNSSQEASYYSTDRDQNSNDYFGKTSGTFRGKGPKGYKRSKDRIEEEVNECLTHDAYIDASEISVSCDENGEVTLKGTCDSRQTKRSIEDIVERVSGVTDVKNEIKVQAQSQNTGYSQSNTKEKSGTTTKSSEKTH